MVRSTKAFVTALAAAILLPQAQGSELGYARTRSASSTSHRLRAGYDFTASHKVSLTLKKTQLSSDVTDKETSSLRGGYRYRSRGGQTVAVELRRDDEAYFFDSVGFGLKYGFNLGDSTRLMLGATSQKHSYTLLSDEVILSQGLSLSLDQRITNTVSVGISAQKEVHRASGRQVGRALNGQTILSTDIESFVGLLYASSLSAFLESSWDKVTIGLSYSRDSYAYATGYVATSEVYADLNLTEALILGVFYSQGKVDYSSTPSTSTGLSLAYGF